MRGELPRNLLLESELLRVADSFSARNLDLVVLKGIPLTHRVYGRLDLRHMVDNDVMVHRADVGRAIATLGALGYAPLFDLRIEDQFDQIAAFAMVRSVGAAGPTLCLELHWTAFIPALYPVPEGLLWEHVEPFELRGRTLKVFDKPLTVVHLAAHFAQHEFRELRILDDFAAAWSSWQSEIHPIALERLARELGMLPVLDYAFTCARELGLLTAATPRFGTSRASALRVLLPPANLSRRRPGHGHAKTLLPLVLADPRRIPAWVRTKLFPPIDNMAVIAGRPVSPALYLRYLTRPFRPLLRALGRQP